MFVGEYKEFSLASLNTFKNSVETADNFTFLLIFIFLSIIYLAGFRTGGYYKP